MARLVSYASQTVALPEGSPAGDGVYEFSAAPLPVTGAAGSPVNPLAIK
ncbi:hypothetical protein AAH991_39415 [Microbispora sp. ZYX-F-249]|uniref:Uncharacterized protein n=1 Tax=Microbispora maris TaxID=3144104 RepID=A0ABV0B137_9ACTN